MLSLFPLIAYLAALLAALLILRGIAPLRHHVIFLIFLAYSAAYGLRFAAQATFIFPFSSVELLSHEEFIETTILLNALLVVAAFAYRLAYQWGALDARTDHDRAVAWQRFTREWGISIYRTLGYVVLACTALALFVRFVVQGDRFVLGFAADVESRQASMGWGFVPFVLSQVISAIVLVAIELRRPRREIVALFMGLVVLALSSGSKGGFLIPLVYSAAYALSRGHVQLTLGRLRNVMLLGGASLALGVFVRGYVESGVWDTGVFLSPIGLLGPLLGRFFAFDITQIMIVHPDTYAGLIRTFQEYFLSSIVPAAAWPGKPLNPCLLLADAVGFPFISCVAPGWIGGVQILLGSAGIWLAPLIVGIVMARIARRAAVMRETISLRQPLLFSVALLWLGVVNEGVYYQLLPVFLPIVGCALLIYFSIIMFSGRLGRLPVFHSAGAAQPPEL